MTKYIWEWDYVRSDDFIGMYNHGISNSNIMWRIFSTVSFTGTTESFALKLYNILQMEGLYRGSCIYSDDKGYFLIELDYEESQS
jgi:hypothetical protein